MSLTEVVYKIKNDSYPLCAFTAKHPDTKVVVNFTSWDEETKLSKTITTVMGDEESVQTVLKGLEGVVDECEILEQSKYSTTLRTTTSGETLAKCGNPAAFALEYFGENAVMKPALVKEGYFNMRVIASGKVDLASMLANYETGVKAGRWNDFKLVRIDSFEPEQQIHGAFTEGLTPKQLEVIKTALALGFYNTPRNITLDDLSNIFGISKAAVHNRLQAAERKVITKFFG